MPRLSRRRVSTALAATVVLCAGLAVGATAASAKSSLEIGVGSRTVAAGDVVRVHATGDSDDFGGVPVQLCIDERVGHGAWQQLKCTPGGQLELGLKVRHPGLLSFRAQLVAVRDAHHRSVDRSSESVTVRVR
ncbi:hypothetical protein ABIA33_000051 [Streptacidiphilus sp. MAP12-16]|uniref:hypothetical protein n=1 Tax=Streptacidiphilus sp. MAP12-16 TaxID=3156300 RepID=UPI00351897E6